MNYIRYTNIQIDVQIQDRHASLDINPEPNPSSKYSHASAHLRGQPLGGTSKAFASQRPRERGPRVSSVLVLPRVGGTKGVMYGRAMAIAVPIQTHDI